MSERPDWSLLVLPTAAVVVLILLLAAWDVVAPMLGIVGPRGELGDKLLLTALVLAGGALVGRLVFVAARRRIEGAEELYTLRKAVSLGLVVISIGLVAAIWVQAVETLALSLGLVGAGLMLALGPVITGVAGWVHIAVSRPYSVGDRIEVGNVRGDVVDVKLLHTILLEVGDHGPTGSIVQVPNNEVLSGKVVNDTKDFSFRWVTIELPVSYESDWRKARERFTSILREETEEATEEARRAIRRLQGKYYLKQRDVTPTVSISFDSNWILLRGRFATPIDSTLEVRNRVYEAVIGTLEEDPEIEIGAESLTVTLEDGEPTS